MVTNMVATASLAENPWHLLSPSSLPISLDTLLLPQYLSTFAPPSKGKHIHAVAMFHTKERGGIRVLLKLIWPNHSSIAVGRRKWVIITLRANPPHLSSSTSLDHLHISEFQVLVTALGIWVRCRNKESQGLSVWTPSSSLSSAFSSWALTHQYVPTCHCSYELCS